MSQFTQQEIELAVKHKFSQGSVATVTDNEVVVRVGKSFTRLSLRDLPQVLKAAQEAQLPKEDLAQVARDNVARERAEMRAAKEAEDAALKEDVRLKRANRDADSRFGYGYDV